MNPNRWAEVERVYHAAAARPAGERAAFLAQACGGDDALRREVESLLAQTASDRGFLDGPAVAVAARMVSETSVSVLTGRRLGVYQVQARIGAGGMGEVYRAHDTKLGRDVAIKILPRHFTSDPDRLARFEREARILASLNHAHIGAIYGFEEADGVRALVLELVEGDTLTDRIARGPIPPPEALAIASQIADALDTAHEKGIVHRDLKPANIKITPDGVVKVLDFGLAKVAFGDASPDLPQSPTVTVGGTQEGVILGTAAYMSPEQARGQIVDKRTDIWAFGCVLYEMLTGRAPFSRDTLTDTLAAIVEREPDWTVLPAATPVTVSRLLRRCVDKDLKRRLRDIGDARTEIEDARSRTSSIEAVQRAVLNPAGVQWLWIAFAVMATLALVVAGVTMWLPRDGRAIVAMGPSAQTIATQLTNYGGTEAVGALSPDGRSFVFVSDRGGTTDIWLRQVSGGEPIRLTNDTVEEADLAYAPDGDSVYFTRFDANAAGIWHMGVLGGVPRKVIDNAQKPALSRDGRSLAYVNSATPNPRWGWEIALSGVSGGDSRTLVRGIPAGIGSPRPAWSPDGRWIAYTTGALFGPLSMFVVDVDTGQQRQVTQFPPGTTESGQPAWLPDSRHLVVPYIPLSRQQSPNDLGIVDIRDGAISRLTTTVADGFSVPSVSADGSRLIATSVSRLSEIWRVPLGRDPDANGRAAVRLVDSSMRPMWSFVSRDGGILLFNSPASGARNLWMMPVDGSAPPRQITAMPGDAVSHSSLSPDSTHVAFASVASGHSDIWTQNIDGSDLRQLTNDEPADSWPVWSPDGHWVAYLSSREGRAEAWRVASSGGSPEKFSGGPTRGDWIRRPEGNGTWIVRGGVELVDVERDEVVWREPLSSAGPALSLPVFSPDGRSISAPFRESRDHDAIRIFDTASGESRVAVRLPFHVAFRASWTDGGHSMIVNRDDRVTHIVLFDHFWPGQSSR